jgi:hypothetical protein
VDGWLVLAILLCGAAALFTFLKTIDYHTDSQHLERLRAEHSVGRTGNPDIDHMSLLYESFETSDLSRKVDSLKTQSRLGWLALLCAVIYLYFTWKH